MPIDVFGLTDIGIKRETNEDNFLCFDLSKRVVFRGNDAYFLGVADGIGGHAGGETASSLAVRIVQETLLQRLEQDGTTASLQSLIEESLQKANVAIFEKASREVAFNGMGTTFTAAFLLGRTAVVANVGDSRAYHIRRKEIRQISLDHSWAAEQLRMGLTEAEILNSPYKNMITRSLGFEKEIKIDHFTLEAEDGDYLLLCTDGLHGPLGDPAILKIFRKKKNPEDISHRLIRSAIRLKSDDNITAVVAHWRGDSTKKRPLSDTVKLKAS